MGKRPKKSKHFLEAACLHAIRMGWPATSVNGVEIVRLKPKVAGPNWRVGRITPEQNQAADAKIRTLVAPLPEKWSLEDD